jgi:hypothetical protein
MDQNNILDKQEAYTAPYAQPKERPVAITVICVLGFVGAGLMIIVLPFIFAKLDRMIGGWYPPYLAFSSIVGLACMIGLWKMKKWAAYTYTAMTVLNQIVMLAMGVWNVFALLVPAIVIAIALYHVKKMD